MSKDVKRMSLEEAESFTSDQVASAIKSCRSGRAYGPDTVSIFHLKNLGPLATEHLTSRYNDSLQSCRLPSFWKTSLVIPIHKPGKDSSQGTSYRPMSLLCPAAKVLEALILPSINEFLSGPANTASDPDTRLHLPYSSSQQTCCCCCRPTPPACSCGGVRQPNYFRAAMSGVSSTCPAEAPLFRETSRGPVCCLMLVLVLDWTQCLPQGVGAPPAMLRGRTTGFP